MCDEAKNVGAFIAVDLTDVSPVQVVPPDNDRVAITFPAGDAADYFISTSRNVSAVDGFRIQPVNPPTVFDRHNAGHLVAQAWWGIAATGTETIAVVVVRNDELQGPEKEMTGNARPR